MYMQADNLKCTCFFEFSKKSFFIDVLRTYKSVQHTCTTQRVSKADRCSHAPSPEIELGPNPKPQPPIPLK